MIDFSGTKISFSIGSFEDFIDNGSLDLLKLNEYSGNKMPEFEMIFNVTNPQILNVLNETNILKISMGLTELKIDTEMIIYHKTIDIKNSQEYNVHAFGMLGNSDYLLIPRRRVFGNQTTDGIGVSGYNILAIVIKENFANADSNMEASSDQMVRVQCNESNKAFVDHLMATMYTPNTFTMCGITIFGKFKFREIRTLSQTEPSWNFTPGAKDEKDIEYKNDFMIDDQSGVMNYLYGYTTQRVFWDSDSGYKYMSQSGNTTMLAMCEGFNRGDVTKFLPQMATNANMYNGYWQATMDQMSYWALFSSVSLQLRFEGWKNVEILDLVNVIQQIDNKDKDPSNENISGLYLISSVSRVFERNSIVTYVTLNRESLNCIE